VEDAVRMLEDTVLLEGLMLENSSWVSRWSIPKCSTSSFREFHCANLLHKEELIRT